MSEQLLTKKDLAQYANVSIGKVELMMGNGLPYIKDGASVRFVKSIVDEYFNSKIVVNHE